MRGRKCDEKEDISVVVSKYLLVRYLLVTTGKMVT